jgi:hypothetical protein
MGFEEVKNWRVWVVEKAKKKMNKPSVKAEVKKIRALQKVHTIEQIE